MDIREIGPGDEVLTRRFWEIGRAADEAGRPWSAYWPWESATDAFRHPGSSRRRTLLAAFDRDWMVGCAELSFPLLDNTHSVAAEVYVDPGHRRRGTGAALLRTCEDVVRADGRRVLGLEVATPVAGPESAGMRLALRHGYRTGVVEEVKVVGLRATEPTWPALREDAGRHLDGYRLRGWLDTCPAELVEGYCRLMETFNDQAPTGTLAVEPERWDEDRLRDKEARFRRSGRHEVCTVALAADGSVAGLTEVMVSDHRPALGFQGGTLVAPAHRGHRLGIAMKLANHEAVRRAHPDCLHLLAANADVNAHMNAVNAALGYRTVERLAELQKELAR